tara:strand:- start:2115 stop:3662 length:1548 start_codon:yes stop_codon:yes gene_type:complete
LKTSKISYKDTNRFNQLVLDFISQNLEVSDLKCNFPNLDEFEKKINENSYSDVDRELLYEVLKDQNTNINLSELSSSNLESVKNKKTFTVTTGHQLCLFTGPLYFIYKIVSAINLSNKLKKTYPSYNFVPLFWLASEDHDFEEVSSINLFQNDIKWNASSGGPVGRMSLIGVEGLISQITDLISPNDNSSKIIDLLKSSYRPEFNLAEATRNIINSLFGKYGILIIDGDDKRLKEKIVDIIDEDINQNTFLKIIEKTNAKILEKYHIQAHVRPINFFKIDNKSRIRITSSISKEEIKNKPEVFSPNVLLRPIYQQKIIPNIAYIGGGAEISYWLQLVDVFKYLDLAMPSLVIRNSVLILDSNQKTLVEKLNLCINDFFENIDLVNKKFLKNSNEDIDLANEFSNLDTLFSSIEEKLKDQNLISSLKAFEKKTKNSFEEFDKKVLRSLKKQKENEILKIKKLHKILFPNNKLQERYENLISMYLKYGDNFIKSLISTLNPLDANFVILEMDSNQNG